MTQRVSLIVAMAKNRVIGAQGRLPWHLSTDLKRFRALTLGHHIIMGRKTYESIGRPLPGRKMIVLTRNAAFSAPQCVAVHSIDAALESAAADNEVFVIGGAELYRQALDRAQRLYLTEIDAEVAGDRVFPEIDRGRWELIERSEFPASAKDGYAHSFSIYERITASWGGQ